MRKYYPILIALLSPFFCNAQTFSVAFDSIALDLCPGISKSFTVSTSGGISPYTYIWSGDGGIDTTSNPSHTVVIPSVPPNFVTSYQIPLQVKVIDSNGDSVLNTLNIHVNSVYTVNILKDLLIDTFTLSTGDPLINNEQINFSIDPDQNIGIYHWYENSSIGSTEYFTPTAPLAVSYPFSSRPCSIEDIAILFWGENTDGCRVSGNADIFTKNPIPYEPVISSGAIVSFPFQANANDTIDVVSYYSQCANLPGYVAEVDLTQSWFDPGTSNHHISGTATFSGTNIFYIPGNSTGLIDLKFKMCYDDPSQLNPICAYGTMQVNIPTPTAIQIDSQKITHLSCKGRNDGSAELSISGGVPPYQVIWFDTNNQVIDTALKITQLSEGVYLYQIYDQFGQTNSGSITISSPDTLLIDSIISTSSSCSGNCSGTAILSISGGTLPYSQLWSTGSANPSLSLVCAGSYTVTVSDANNCQSVSAFTIQSTGSNQLTVSIQGDTLSCKHQLANVSAIPTGGNGHYTFSWSTGDTIATISLTQPAVLSVNVHDSIHCGSAIYHLQSTAKNIQVAIQSTPGNCNGQTGIGTALAIPSGGTAPYSFKWSTSPVQTTPKASGLNNTSYIVTVTDIDSCVATQSVVITQDPYIIRTSLTTTDANCSNNGSATITTYGGTPPYSYNWSTTPIQTKSTANNLTKGNYNVTMTDSLGCYTIVPSTIHDDSINVISGQIINDVNNNCRLDSNEQTIPYQTIYIMATNGQKSYYSYIDNNGHFELHVGNGKWVLSIMNQQSLPCASFCFDDTVIFNNLCNTVNVPIFIHQSALPNFAIHPGWNAASPGFSKSYWVYYSNLTTNIATPTSITFVYDSNLLYVNSSPPASIYDSIHHTLTWTNLNTVYIGAPNNYVLVVANFIVPANLPLGTQLHTQMEIQPIVSDCSPYNNTFNWTEVVSGSLDPNEKIAYPSNAIDVNDSVIKYKINFQNTGTDTALFIEIKDTLSQWLDPSSVRTIATSHPYTFSIKDQSALSWRFDPIFLPDSNKDERNSHGFVMYEVKKKSNTPVGTAIKNTAYIYFDYNTAVITNTTNTNVHQTASIDSHIEPSKYFISVYPNPFSEGVNFTISDAHTPWNIIITDVIGNKVKEIKDIRTQSSFIKREHLPEGMYIYTIVIDHIQVGTGKLIIH